MVMPASRWAPRPRLGVAGFPWNQWQLCSGISGNFRVEQVAALAWNRWQDSPGIGGSFRVEYATVGVLEQAAIHELIDLPEVCARLLTTNFRIKDYIIHNVLARDAARKAAAHAQPPEPQET